MIPVHTPNLPTAQVKCVVIAGESNIINESLNKLSIKVLNCETNPSLENSINNHADMLVYHFGDIGIILSSEQTFLFNDLSILKYSVKYTKSIIKSPYPNDVYLNAARLGKYLICNPKLVAREILAAAEYDGLKIISVNQGYSKCSICVINELSIITDDRGIAHACESKGINTLLISKGSIKLNGHNYGFIGGCTGLIDKNRLAFCGNINKHKDYNQILNFLNKHGIEPVNLYEGDLLDIGGILPIMQVNK